MILSVNVRRWMAAVFTVLVATGLLVLIGSPAQASIRSLIVDKARAEIGVSGTSSACARYGDCSHPVRGCSPNGSGARPACLRCSRLTPRGRSGSGGGDGVFKPRPAGGTGNPAFGDIAVFGEPGPDTAVGGHVGIVVAVYGDGTIDTVNGNFSNEVQFSHLDPRTRREGVDQVLISGYVSPPNAGSPITPPHDFSGDRVADVMGIRSNGELRYFPNNIASTGVPASTYLVTGQNFNAYSRVLAGDISGDGVADLLGVTDGNLYYFPNNIGSNPGGVPFTTRIATGQAPDVNRMFLADFGGDGRADILAVTNSGEMRCFPNQLPNSSGAPFGPFLTLGSGWQAIGPIGIGDVSGDGVADLVSTTSSGQYYPNNSGSNPNHVPFTSCVPTGSTTDLYRLFVGDVTGDGYGDLVAVTTSASCATTRTASS